MALAIERHASIVSHPTQPGMDVGFVRADSVIIDRTYQRDERAIEKLARDWEDLLVGCIVVTTRDPDHLAVLDGQRRVLAARRLGKTVWLPALFVHTESLEEDAYIYFRLNRDRLSLQAFELFKAELVAKIPEAVEIKEIADRYDIRIANANGAHVTKAISTLRKVHRLGRLGETLQVITTVWPLETHDERLNAVIIDAVGTFLRWYPKAKRDRLVATLIDISPKQLISAMMDAAPAAGTRQGATSKSAPLARVNVLVKEYNKGLRSGKLQPAKPSGRMPVEQTEL